MKDREDMKGRSTRPTESQESDLDGGNEPSLEDMKGRPTRPTESQRFDLEDWENEPPLEASQIAEIEDQIGGGLIEEVIQVAEGEHQLVDIMLESRPWEELEEKPPKGPSLYVQLHPSILIVV
ncbi:MAG: hypothetical protein Q9211_007068 [Gyalolechia sp. 1 TL-2023]